MIELLNDYRLAKQKCEQAARELGCAFGKAFEKENRDGGKFQDERFDNLTPPDEPTIGELSKLFYGNAMANDTFTGQAFSKLVKRQPDATHTIGLPEIEGSQIAIEEAHLVKGFIDGFNESRSSKPAAPANGVQVCCSAGQ